MYSVQPVPNNAARPTHHVIYAASSIATYRTQEYDQMLGIVRTYVEAMPWHPFFGGTVRPARDLYTSTDEWLEKWPDELHRLTDLVFITDSDGCIGHGVWCEIWNTAHEGKGVWYLDADDKLLIPLQQIRFLAPSASLSALQCARVVVDWEAVSEDVILAEAGL